MGVIYKISSLIDNRSYIGSSIDYPRRHREHLNDLKKDKHANMHLQNFYNKHGVDKLSFDVIEECDDSIVLEREQLLIDSTDNLFNISLDASAPMTGREHSKKTKEHFSKIRTGEGNSMYGTKRAKHVVDAMQANRWSNVTKKEKVIRKINRKLRKELIIENGGKSLRCMSYEHAARIIGVKHQSVQSAVKRKTFSCKGWSIKVCDNKLYTDALAEDYLHLFDDNSFYPQLKLVNIIIK